MNALLSIDPPFILASQSPRRRALLERMNVSFRVQVSPADEHVEEAGSPAQTARQLATRKAIPVAEAHPSALVLAADTVVSHDGHLLGKPDSPAEATAMLEQLSGTIHAVHTGIALHHANTGRAVSADSETRVTFASLQSTEIEAYVATGSPMDKAGAYGIQDHTGPLFVERLEGDYYNVVGLPLRRLYETLRTHFGDLLYR